MQRGETGSIRNICEYWICCKEVSIEISNVHVEYIILDRSLSSAFRSGKIVPLSGIALNIAQCDIEYHGKRMHVHADTHIHTSTQLFQYSPNQSGTVGQYWSEKREHGEPLIYVYPKFQFYNKTHHKIPSLRKNHSNISRLAIYSTPRPNRAASIGISIATSIDKHRYQPLPQPGDVNGNGSIVVHVVRIHPPTSSIQKPAK